MPRPPQIPDDLSTREGKLIFDAEFRRLGWDAGAEGISSRRDPNDLNLARDLYFAYLALASARVGGNLLFHHSYVSKVVRLQRRINHCLDETTGTDHGVICPASPWHALLFLFRLEFQARDRIGPLAFRGQANIEWPLKPTLWRSSIKERHIHTLAKMALDRRVRLLFEPAGLTWRSDWLEPLAQHYGLATELLDWTTDPMVAICFATLRVRPGDHPVVFAQSTSRLNQLGSSLVVPPVWMERVHRQLGFFVQGSESGLAAIHAESIKLRLPKWTTESRPIRLSRDANPVALLRDAQRLALLVRACLEDPQSKHDTGVVRWFSDVVSGGWFDKNLPTEESAAHLYEFLYRSCIVESPVNGSSTFNSADLRRFAKHNLSSIAELVPRLREYGRVSGSTMDEGLASFLEASLYPARIRKRMWAVALQGTWTAETLGPSPVMRVVDRPEKQRPGR